jgi:SHS2 domain-containing protein
VYDIFEHTADFGLRVRADSLPRLFEEAAVALFAVMGIEPATVRRVETVKFHIPGTRLDDLLHDWLAELLFTFATRRLVLGEFTVELRSDGLTATARGEPFDPRRHELDVEVKAITYHGLRLEQLGNQWLAEVIVDT